MVFDSYDYFVFILAVFTAYWLLRAKSLQNLMLLGASYLFYGYVHPWFLILLGVTTVMDYFAALGMERFPQRRRMWLLLSVTGNLGMLGAFKYFNFFTDNVYAVLTRAGFHVDPVTLRIFLPVGISFYTFQEMGYTIDVYRGGLKPRKNFIDFALFVVFFPQLVAGPIERAGRLLTQIEVPRRWNWERFRSAWPLLVTGYLKKLVIADNVAVYADKVYALDHPPFLILAAGTLAFAVQILADFSAYTDIARGSARLLGFELMENFKSPYLAISPSDFWRRWHISFSTWIRDYLYIPLGGSRVSTRWRFFLVLVTTFGLSGLWHGAAWHFIFWGVYNGLLLFIYHSMGRGGRWAPVGLLNTLGAWLLMFAFTQIGWFLFRAPSLDWMVGIFQNFSWGFSGDSLAVGLVIMALVGLYASPLFFFVVFDRFAPQARLPRAVVYGLTVSIILALCRDVRRDFIYFQF